MENSRKGLVSMMIVTMAVIAVVVCGVFFSTNSMSPMQVSRRLGGTEATPQENKMAFKAMKLNTKYELKTEQKTILRGGTILERHDAAASMKANIYAGIKDMKKVVLEGLPGAIHNHRRLSNEETEQTSIPTKKIAAKASEVGGEAPSSKKEAKADIQDLRSEIKTDKKMLPKVDTKEEKKEIKTEIKDDKKAIENDQVVVLDSKMMTANKATSVKQSVALPSGVTEPTKGTTLLPPKKNSELGQIAGDYVAKSSSSNLVDGKETKASSSSSSSKASSSSSSSSKASSSKTLSSVKDIKVKDEEKKDDVKDEKKVEKKSETAAVAGKEGKTKDNKEEKEVDEKTEKKEDKKEKEPSEKSNPKLDELDHRKLPSVVHVKGAYKAMKGQIKTSMLMSKPYVLQTSDKGSTFPIKHDAIRALKLQIKGAINGERAIVETDDDDDYSIRRLFDETKAKIARKMDAAQAAAQA